MPFLILRSLGILLALLATIPPILLITFSFVLLWKLFTDNKV